MYKCKTTRNNIYSYVCTAVSGFTSKGRCILNGNFLAIISVRDNNITLIKSIADIWEDGNISKKTLDVERNIGG